MATKVNVIKLIDFVGFKKISALNSLLSIISGVLFVVSQITTKSTNPRFAWMSRRNGSTILINPLLVTSSLSSNNCACAAPSKPVQLLRTNDEHLFCQMQMGKPEQFYHQISVPLPVWVITG